MTAGKMSKLTHNSDPSSKEVLSGFGFRINGNVATDEQRPYIFDGLYFFFLVCVFVILSSILDRSQAGGETSYTCQESRLMGKPKETLVLYLFICQLAFFLFSLLDLNAPPSSIYELWIYHICSYNSGYEFSFTWVNDIENNWEVMVSAYLLNLYIFIFVKVMRLYS